MKKSLFVMFILCYCVQAVWAQQPTLWRGHNHSGIFEATNLLDVWPENGPEMLWHVDTIGSGYGSPAMVGDRLYIQGTVDSLAALFAFDLKGNMIWKKTFGREWIVNYPGSRACPTVVGDLIYVTTGYGGLACLTTDGKEKWSVDLKKDFQGEYTRFGHSEAPAIDGGKVFLMPGGKEYNVVALNRFTGKLIWSNKGVGERPAYSSPNIIRLKKRNVLVGFSAYTLMGLDAETGDLLWTHAQDNLPVEKRTLGSGDTHSNIVYFEAPYIYYVAGDGNCGVKLELSKDGSSITEIWRSKDFDDYMGGFVKLGDYLYAGATAKKRFVAASDKDGSITGTLRLGSGTTVASDGLIYYYSQRGYVSLIKPNAGQPEVISTFKISLGNQEHFAQPVIDRGVLYIRHGNELMAFKVQK